LKNRQQKAVIWEVNGTVILPSLVFPDSTIESAIFMLKP
jgi:hypothetical protein